MNSVHIFKKMLQWLIIVSLFTSLISIIPISIAQNNNIISIGTVTIGAGENVTLPITIINATGVAAVGIKLSYNGNVVNVTGATNGSFLQKVGDFFAFDGRNSANGWMIINTYILGANLTGNLTIANITLKAIASGESPLDIAILAMADQYATPINGSTQNGSIKIASSSTPVPPSSPGGGGGGGGGGSSGENYSNIDLIEKYDIPIYKDKITSYRFNNVKNPIMYVNITGNVSTEPITTMVEVLKGTSIYVKEPAPGIVYKNANVWVGLKGFATPKNIKDGVIRFRVEKSWISSNDLLVSDITMLRWNESKWVTLETKEADKDSEFIFFEAKTYAFSPFAITGLKEKTETPGVYKVQMTEIVTATPILKETIPEKISSPVNVYIIYGVLLIMAAILVVYFVRRK